MLAVSTLAVVYGSIASRRRRLGVGHFQLRRNYIQAKNFSDRKKIVTY